MTQQRRDTHSTEFGIWLRNQSQIDSSLGFTATNIDYMWQNYKTGEWMLIEEKRYMTSVKFPQSKMFEILHRAISDSKYKGLHILIFEKTSPYDGKVYLDGKEVTVEQLVSFLRFEL